MKKRPFCLTACLITLLVVILHTLGMMDHTEKIRNMLIKDPLFGTEGLSSWDEVQVLGQICHITEKDDTLSIRLRSAQIIPVNIHIDPSRHGSLRYFAASGCYLQVSLKNTLLQPVSGQYMLVSGKIVFPEAPTCPGQFDQLRYANVNGLLGNVVSAAVKQYAPAVSGDTLLEKARSLLLGAYEKVLSPEDSAAMAAITLGEKGSLSADRKRLFQDGGISHILAISGLHINLLGMGLYRMLRARRRSILFSALSSSLFLFLYCAMTGMSRSSLRASIMFAVWCTAQITGRSADTLSALALSACLLLCASPLAVFDGGFQLSFGCILSLQYLGPFFKNALCVKENHKISDSLRSSLGSSLAIFVGTLPLMCRHFYQFNPYSPLINLIVIPSMSLLVLSGFLGALCGCLSIPLGIMITAPCHYLLSLFCRVCLFFLKLPGACLVTGRPTLLQIMIYYLLLYLLVTKKRWSPVLRGLLLTLSLVLLCTLFPVYGRSRVVFLDVGQGLCVIMQSGRSALVYDGGSSSVTDVFAYRIEPALKSMGIRRVTLMNSHGDLDHLSGFQEWAQQYCTNLIGGGLQGITVERVCFSILGNRDDTAMQLAGSWESSHVPVSFLSAGQLLQLGDLHLRVLYPDNADFAENSNENSMVVLVTHSSGRRILLTGDMEKDAEVRFADRYRDLGAIDLLCLGHHGSKYASSEDFLSCFSPDAAIASAGKNNRYHHPSEEVMARLRNNSIPMYRTDTQGSIIVCFSRSGRLRFHCLNPDSGIKHLIQ